MTILTLKPDALTVADFDYATVYPFMGLNEGGNSIMSAPVGPQWPLKGYFGMGYYLYGRNLNTYFLGGWDTSSGPKQAAYDAIQTTWANRVLPWFVATPASDNTCTNAAVRVTNGQCYILSASTGLWTRADDYGQNFVTACTNYDVGGTTTSHGASITVMTDSINIPAFPFCQTSADWAAASSTAGKYRLLHTGTTERIVIADPTDVAGVFCVFESQIISTNGSALNGVPKFLMQAGIDAGYDNDDVGVGKLLGAPYSPAIAGSRWSLINTDGTRRKHYVGTFLHADSYQDLTSDYSVGGGVSVLTAAQFQANFPRRSYQATL